MGAPVGVYLLDRPRMRKGLPAAIATGLLVGAGEGLGIASYQYVTAQEGDEWGFLGFSRAMALGATLGGAAGFASGYYLEPSPRSSALTMSSVLWGTAIGSMVGYGASEEGVGFSGSNDRASLGGFIGFNVGLGAGAGLSAAFIPTWTQLGWMWAGAGIGAGASLPVFLAYAGEDSPPAKRGLIFTGTATLIGIAAGAVFASGGVSGRASVQHEDDWPALPGQWATVTYVGPMPVERGGGIQVGGLLL